MTKWTHDNPITTHLINLLITALFVAIGFFSLIHKYGDKLDQFFVQTQIIYDVMINL